MLLTGCIGMKVLPTDNAPVVPAPKSDQDLSKKKPTDLQTQPQTPTKPPTEKPNPRALAALTLIEQGRAFIKANKPDDAIRVLERAMNLHPQNGKVYYYLAEAWLLKGNIRQASEYNGLAEQYFESKSEWGHRALWQKKEIQGR